MLAVTPLHPYSIWSSAGIMVILKGTDRPTYQRCGVVYLNSAAQVSVCYAVTKNILYDVKPGQEPMNANDKIRLGQSKQKSMLYGNR